ncbi:MAG: hypothetical protein CMI53_00935 [Parcubacteria group bacterium]|nr:hypothetical protein [Parcubacteria group bacterium]
MLDTALAVKILFWAGIANVIFILLVFFSCRCLAGQKITTWLFRYSWFKKVYKYHCYYWWAFFVSVLIHTFLAFYVFGFNL